LSTEKDEFVLEKFGGIIDYAIEWQSNKKKLTKNTKSKSHIKTSVFEQAFLLDDKYDTILKVLLQNPASSTQDICNNLNPTMDDNGYRIILRRVKELSNLGLIEEVLPDASYIGNMSKNTIPYQLTLIGIIYVILNFGTNVFLWSDPLKQLLCNYNYPFNLLFQYFLYPYFTKETLLCDMELRIDFLRYLRSICKIIQGQIGFYYSFTHPELTSTNLIDDKYIPEHLFNWSKSNTQIKDTNEKINERLIKYLYKEFKWNWIQHARITLDYDGNKIEIQDKNSNYALIIISTTSKTAILRYRGITYSNLFKVFLNEQTISVAGKGYTVKNSLDPGFLFNCQKELLSLLFSFQCRSVNNEKLRNILSKDPKYRKTIGEMIRILKFKVV